MSNNSSTEINYDQVNTSLVNVNNGEIFLKGQSSLQLLDNSNIYITSLANSTSLATDSNGMIISGTASNAPIFGLAFDGDSTAYFNSSNVTSYSWSGSGSSRTVIINFNGLTTSPIISANANATSAVTITFGPISANTATIYINNISIGFTGFYFTGFSRG